MGDAVKDFSETVEAVFSNASYFVTVSTISGDTLCVEVEQKSDCSKWRGDFTSRYIEDITSKTGNYKKFPVFVKMLLSAVKNASDSVFVDLLTYQDLEMLKNRKAGPQAGQAAARQPVAPSNKRYLILTYAAEFDRVHYPLPLLYDESPDPNHLKAIISQLRQEVDALQTEAGSRAGSSGRGADGHVSAELRRLREENSALRQQLKVLERSTRPSPGAEHADLERLGAETREVARELKLVRKERDLLQARVEAAEAELERERGLHRRELRRRGKETQEVHDELGRAKEQVRELKLRIRQLGDELEAREARRASTSSVERMRNVYAGRGSGDGYGSRPSSSGRGTGAPSYGYRQPPVPGPAPGRSNSRGRDTSSRERSRPSTAPSPPRPSSSRFDPTEYVRAKKEREAIRSRGTSPARSAASSRASSVAGSRPASADRSRRESPTASRPSSSDRYRAPSYGQRPASSERRPAAVAHTADPYQPKSRSGSPGAGRAPQGAWGDPSPTHSAGNSHGSWSKFPPVRSASAGYGREGAPAPPPVAGSSPRSMSPGRALQEVKQKLNAFVQGKGAGLDDPGTGVGPSQGPGSAATSAAAAVRGGAGAGPSLQGSKPVLFNEASAEIADIDSRLHALQNFLRMAKASSTSSMTS